MWDWTVFKLSPKLLSKNKYLRHDISCKFLPVIIVMYVSILPVRCGIDYSCKQYWIDTLIKRKVTMTLVLGLGLHFLWTVMFVAFGGKSKRIMGNCRFYTLN